MITPFCVRETWAIQCFCGFVCLFIFELLSFSHYLPILTVSKKKSKFISFSQGWQCLHLMGAVYFSLRWYSLSLGYSNVALMEKSHSLFNTLLLLIQNLSAKLCRMWKNKSVVYMFNSSAITRSCFSQTAPRELGPEWNQSPLSTSLNFECGNLAYICC